MKPMKRKVFAGLAGLLALLLAHAPVAMAGPGGPGAHPTVPGSDDVTTSPRQQAPTGPGFVLRVPTELVGQVLSGIRGQGQMRIVVSDSETTTIALSGRFVAVLPHSLLETKGFGLRYLGQPSRQKVLRRPGRLILIQR